MKIVFAENINPQVEEFVRTNLTNRKASETKPEAQGSVPMVLYKGRNTVMRMVLEDGKSIIVKKFKRPNIFQRISSLFGRSKAAKSFYNATTLIERRFETPLPLAFIESAPEDYYVCEEDFGVPLAEAASPSIAEAFARFIASLHFNGIIHRDLNNTNVRVRYDEKGEPIFTLIDINRMDLTNPGKYPPLRKCLDNLHRFSGCDDFYKKVLTTYLKERGIYNDKLYADAIRRKRRHDESFTRRKAFNRKLKSLLGH